MNPLRIALAQSTSKIGSVNDNLRSHKEAIKKAQDRLSNIVCFPELSLTGYLLKDLAFEIAPACREAVESLKQVITSGEVVIAGYVKTDNLGHFRNSAAVIDTQGIRGDVSKFYLPTYGLFEEMRYFAPGDPLADLKVFETVQIKFGIAICEDIWHAEPIEALARMGAQVIFCLASSPVRGLQKTQSNGASLVEDQWCALLKAHALMNNIFVVFVNRAGPEDEEYFWGGSMVVSPSGQIVASAKRFEEDLLVVDLDIDDVGRARRFSSFRDHKQRLHEVLERL